MSSPWGVVGVVGVVVVVVWMARVIVHWPECAPLRLWGGAVALVLLTCFPACRWFRPWSARGGLPWGGRMAAATPVKGGIN